MKIRISCPHCVGTGSPTLTCSWCHGFGEMIKAERVCTECLPSDTECPVCGGTHRVTHIYPARSHSELKLLPSEYLISEEN